MSTSIKRMLFAFLLLAGCAAGTVILAQTSKAPAPGSTGNAKVDKLLSQMTIEEKISMVHGAPEDAGTARGQAGYLPGVPRLGIPSLRFTDGPQGIATRDLSTGMPATMALAATFSRDDAKQNGVVIGRDARALGQDVVLEPFVNMVRDFGFGRAYNTFGEDPFLTGQIGAEMIRGVQAQGVMAQAKHYIAYEGGNDVVVDPQTLREIYVAPFVDAIDADVSSMMCSYNMVNGPYACGNGEVQNTILRKEDGFKGFITSDWGATHGTLFINEGLDLEMPGAAEGGAGRFGGRGSFFLARPIPSTSQGAEAQAGRGGGRGQRGGLAGLGGPGGLGLGGGVPEEQSGTAPAGRGGRGGRGGSPDPAPLGMVSAVQSGQVKESTVDTAVARILLQMDRFGLLDKAPKHTVTAEDHAFNAPIIRRTAEHAAVLLKNDGQALPLTSADLGSVAFIGPGAGQTVAIGLPGEKSLGIPDHQVGPVAAIEKVTGRKVIYAPANDMTGTPVPASALSHGGSPGLLRTDKKSGQTQADSQVNFTRSNNKALPAESSTTWEGTLTVPSDGSYVMALQILAAGGSVSIDGQPVRAVNGVGRGGALVHAIQDNVLPTTDNLDNARAIVALKAGAHALSVTADGVDPQNPVQVRLNWVTPEQQKANYQAAISAAKRAKKAVVFVWGRDRPEVFALPGDQDKLVEDVAAVNPNTIVVLNTSLPVAMPWLPRAKSVLQMWWPGDEGGPATANILLGRASPAGRLPITWPQALTDMVARDAAHPERANAGVAGKTTYSEGIFMGYRWFDKQDLKPVYPFGHGLSYTTFDYTGLKVAPSKDGGLDVSFVVKNTGRVAGDDVPQVYIGAPKNPPARAQFAVRALVQFDRVTVPAGQSRQVAVHVAPRRLQYWSAELNAWRTAPGPRTIYVGASSRDLRLQTDVNIAARTATSNVER